MSVPTGRQGIGSFQKLRGRCLLFIGRHCPRLRPIRQSNNSANGPRLPSPPATRRLSDRDRTPIRTEDRDRTPIRTEDRDRTPTRTEDRDRTPIRTEDRDRTPIRTEDRDRTPIRTEDRDRTPIRTEDRDRTPIRTERLKAYFWSGLVLNPPHSPHLSVLSAGSGLVLGWFWAGSGLVLGGFWAGSGRVLGL
uniref:Uncharacterized protein n=1 Tax=Salmo trutta TaxID=8032 RepID=A0A674ERU3_SALTR